MPDTKKGFLTVPESRQVEILLNKRKDILEEMSKVVEPKKWGELEEKASKLSKNIEKALEAERMSSEAQGIETDPAHLGLSQPIKVRRPENTEEPVKLVLDSSEEEAEGWQTVREPRPENLDEPVRFIVDSAEESDGRKLNQLFDKLNDLQKWMIKEFGENKDIIKEISLMINKVKQVGFEETTAQTVEDKLHKALKGILEQIHDIYTTMKERNLNTKYIDDAANSLEKAIRDFYEEATTSKLGNESCECGGLGWDLFFLDSSGELEIEKCDHCNVFKSDDEAGKAAWEILKPVMKQIKTNPAVADTPFSDIKGTEPGAKDLRRMADIQFKAAGDKAKIEQLINQMAGAITKKDKAIRRARAAEEVFKGELGKKMAKIFLNKAKALGQASEMPIWIVIDPMSKNATIDDVISKHDALYLRGLVNFIIGSMHSVGPQFFDKENWKAYDNEDLAIKDAEERLSKAEVEADIKDWDKVHPAKLPEGHKAWIKPFEKDLGYYVEFDPEVGKFDGGIINKKGSIIKYDDNTYWTFKEAEEAVKKLEVVGQVGKPKNIEEIFTTEFGYDELFGDFKPREDFEFENVVSKQMVLKKVKKDIGKDVEQVKVKSIKFAGTTSSIPQHARAIYQCVLTGPANVIEKLSGRAQAGVDTAMNGVIEFYSPQSKEGVIDTKDKGTFLIDGDYLRRTEGFEPDQELTGKNVRFDAKLFKGKKIAVNLRVQDGKPQDRLTEKDLKDLSEKIGGQVEDEPDEDNDIFIHPTGPLGSKYSVNQSGKHIGEFESYEEMEKAIKGWMSQKQYRPNVWNIDDHGGIELYKMEAQAQLFKVGDEVVWTNPQNNKKFDAEIIGLMGNKAEIEFEAKYDPSGEGKFETIIQEVNISELQQNA